MLNLIGYQEALDLVLTHVPVGLPEELPLSDLVGRILAEDALARVDSPSVNASLKDGYAVISSEVESADPDHPVRLKIVGSQTAGTGPGAGLESGTTVRVTTGAPLPPGAEAVLAGEYAREEDGFLWCWRDAEPGRNVLHKGTDVAAGLVAAERGRLLNPALIGLLAAAGLDRARVISRPRLAVIATGDEVVAPGRVLPEGKLYASNLTETVAWLKTFGLPVTATDVVPDHPDDIRASIDRAGEYADAFITSGGAWTSERDLLIGVMNELGWHGVFHRVRLGPGKAVAFGLLRDRPVFILPGGPPSHEAAFLLLALPGLMAMSGWQGPVFPRIPVRLKEKISGRAKWTQCLHAEVLPADDGWLARQIKSPSRLTSMARKNAFILLPEGVSEIAAGRWVEALLLSNCLSGC